MCAVDVPLDLFLVLNDFFYVEHSLVEEPSRSGPDLGRVRVQIYVHFQRVDVV